MKDLGVIFDSELNFVQRCKEKINTAYSYLGFTVKLLIQTGSPVQAGGSRAFCSNRSWGLVLEVLWY